MIPWSLLYLCLEWGIRLAMLPVVVRRRRPSVATAWLLVIFFQPVVGLGAYLLLGENRLPRRRIRRHARVHGVVAVDGRYETPRPHVVQPELAPEQRGLVHLAERLSDMPIVGGNGCELLTDTRRVIDRLIADINAAEHHVHLLFYIFEDDPTGRRVAEAVERAAQRGVTCRVLVDTVGSWGMLKRLGPRMARRGVEVVPMLTVNPFRRRLARIDLRNHRKLAVIDGRVGYAGSQNIVEPTYGRKNLVWHDMTARLTGPIVLQLQGVFAEDWYFETDRELDEPELFPRPDVHGDVAIQTLPSGPVYPTEGYHRLVVAALHAAQRRVVITSPYLVPDEPLLQAMQVAAMRGTRVQMVVPARSDQHMVAAAGRSYYRDLLEMGVEVHLHGEGLLHAKTMTVDDAMALIGSGNFDIRSFYLNFELNMLMYGPHVTAELRYAQQRYIAESRRLSLREWSGRPKAYRLGEDVARLLSPLL